MIIYRPHKGQLVDSMAEAKEFENEFENELEMKKFIHEDWHHFGENLFSIDDIVIDDSSEINDDRVDWEDTKYVCVKRMGNKDYMALYGTPQCVGMCATKYPKRS